MLKKAMTTLEFLSQDAQTRMVYEARLKFLRDEASRMEGAKEEGRTEGLAEGLAEGVAKEKRETARKLLARGDRVASVAEFTQLFEQDVRAILEEHWVKNSEAVPAGIMQNALRYVDPA
jgi:predicted transposase/invertase (TIGR01784 family)